MKIGLMTDAPKHNLALMKLATYHKACGDEVFLAKPMDYADKTYGSWLFNDSPKYPCDEAGGTGLSSEPLSPRIAELRPDYELFGLEHSLGYTWSYCPRKCRFCVVAKQNNPKKHHSIWDFHEGQFDTIELLNNNTFSDPQWRETFEEIWEADLTVIEHGFDLRLLDEEKAEALAKTRFVKQIHFAWDTMRDEKGILQGIAIARQYHLNAMVYVLMGFDTTIEEDLYRCQKIHEMGFDPFPMLYKETPVLLNLRRCIYLRYYRHYETIEKAWHDYGFAPGAVIEEGECPDTIGSILRHGGRTNG